MAMHAAAEGHGTGTGRSPAAGGGPGTGRSPAAGGGPAALDAREAAAVSAIDEVRLVEDLRALIGVPSITGREEAVQDVVAGLMAEAGLAVRRSETDPVMLAGDPDFPGYEMPRERIPVVSGDLGRAGSGPRLMILGHVDVVPTGDPGQWDVPPFEARVADGRVFGRGACDMKGGVAAALAAFRAVAAITNGGADLAGSAIFVAVPGEEDGGSGTLAAIRAGETADLAIIPEPTHLDIVAVHAGAITFTLEVPGRAAHASTPREGVSALEKLFVLAEALREDEAARCASETRPEMRVLGLPYPTIIGKVSGGDWASTVMDRVVAEGRYGVRAGQAPAEAELELRAAIGRACAADEYLRDHSASVEITGARFSSGEIAADHPLAVGLADVTAEVTGIRSPIVGVPYGADMSLLINAGGIPTVMFGPGDVRLAHAPNESVPVAELVATARVLAVWLLRGLR